jgi:hypothetical protein
VSQELADHLRFLDQRNHAQEAAAFRAQQGVNLVVQPQELRSAASCVTLRDVRLHDRHAVHRELRVRRHDKGVRATRLAAFGIRQRLEAGL